MVICLERGADLHLTQLMPLPLTISCSSKSRLVLPSWFYLSGTAHPVVVVVVLVCCVRMPELAVSGQWLVSYNIDVVMHIIGTV